MDEAPERESPESIATLRKLLRYEPKTGKLFWRKRDVAFFTDGKQPAERVCRTWNTQFSGREAFTALNGGYRHGTFLNRNYYAHRVVWAIHFGKWPKFQIDHVNGDKLDNRISNLRDVPQSLNQRNLEMRLDNTTGHTGVSWHKGRSRWQARATINGKDKYLGVFERIEDAVAARQAFNREHGYTERHGLEIKK